MCNTAISEQMQSANCPPLAYTHKDHSR
ncbi:hypothetical protein M3J09_011242 [Ascochyta lentis]